MRRANSFSLNALGAALFREVGLSRRRPQGLIDFIDEILCDVDGIGSCEDWPSDYEIISPRSDRFGCRYGASLIVRFSARRANAWSHDKKIWLRNGITNDLNFLPGSDHAVKTG